MKHNLRKDRGGYSLILLIISIIFLVISFALLLITKTEWKDVYAAACSIAGGVIGGVITLEGVKRTILAQREITLEGVKETIEAQRNIESQKLIPHKLVKLHQLEDKIDNFSTSLFKIPIARDNLQNNKAKPRKELIELIKSEHDRLYKLHDIIIKNEYEFIEVTSQVDIDTYKKLTSYIRELKLRLAKALHNYESLDFLAEDTYKDVEDKVIIEYIEWFIEQLSEFGEWAIETLEELLITIPLKLEQYEKEML
ncbi:hypothetical protein [Priestia megaterium]|uniref:hypothetical protein n=1 Tax=Priestia megaterium TaxID=1404 RepID=UPI0011B46113|nr:hypothetical protein [Priestia megaterium]QDZ88697.1 hypothetical protein D0441_31155 [Priestia megaterium]